MFPEGNWQASVNWKENGWKQNLKVTEFVSARPLLWKWRYSAWWSSTGDIFFYHAEQQKQLKLIHEKFKEDINQYLQDCSSTLEGMEAHHIELKGTVEKQSMENLIVVSVDFSLLFQCIIAMFWVGLICQTVPVKSYIWKFHLIHIQARQW